MFINWYIKGTNPSDLSGSNTGVFIGVVESDAHYAMMSDAPDMSGFAQTGCNHTMLANRISYHLDLRRPSYAINTACSSSATALHQAVINMRNGQCDAAIVGGVCLCLQPQFTMTYNKLNMLSKDCKCKFLDQSAD